MNQKIFNIILIFNISILIIYLFNKYPKIIMTQKKTPDNYNNIYIDSYKM